MKNKVIAIIAIIAVVCIAWIAVLSISSSQGNRVKEIVQEIEANVEVKTYKNTIPMYEELIKIEPENIKWYIGLADAYLEIEQYGNYKKQCEQILAGLPSGGGAGSERIAARRAELLEKMEHNRAAAAYMAKKVHERGQIVI